MTKKHESLRGLYDLHVLLVVCEFGRPAKESEIEEKTNFPMTSLALWNWAKRGCIDHDEDVHTWCINDTGHTWCINDTGHTYLLEAVQRENNFWKGSQE